MFSSFFLKSFRVLLLPFSLLYWLGITVRNFLFDKKISRSSSFALPVICVGNLSVGGTGKSPMVEYLLRLLKDRYKVATVSRGYKRKTKGYALAGDTTTALDIGDEPMQFHLKFPDVPVAVGERRIVAIPQLLQDRPDTQVIVLDDAFQHRQIKAGLNVLLTDCNNLFTRDFYLPAGDLRDLKSAYKRAQIIVVTKCDPQLSKNSAAAIEREINPLPAQTVFFSAIEYGELYHVTSQQPYQLSENTEVILVSGIANPRPLKELLEDHCGEYHLQQYSDHHIFTIDDLKDIRQKFDALSATQKIILTTEKDATRLAKFKKEIADLPLYVIPIRHHFLFDGGDQFNQLVVNFIQDFGPLPKQ